MRSYIESLDARYPGGNTIIVTTRPALCKRDLLLLKDYHHLELEDFNDKEITQYLHAWYGSLEPDQHIARAGELKRIIDNKVYLKEIAKTPLYLALIGRMHRYEARLPMDRLPLYNHIAKLLLSYAPHTPDGPESKRLLLAKTAFYIQELAVKENRSAITRKELHEILTPNMIETLHGDNRQVETQVDEFLEEMQTQSGFLVEDAPDTFRFSYKTFQEYFASKWVVDENSANGDFNYTPYIENPARHETLMFVLALLPEEDSKKILTQILEKGNVPPFYLKSVNLENIKCFKGKHDLNLSHDDKTHAQWTVLLGNNGTGKTTLLQAIASLDPLRLKSVYEITSHDVRNQEFEIAAGGGKNTFLKKVRGKVAYDLKNKSAEIRFFVRHIDEIYGWLIPGIELDKLDALTIYAYGATRKASDGALTGETNTNRHDNLFSNTDLMNPEEWLAQFDYSAKRDGGTATLLLERIKKILLDILPDVKAFAIKGRSDYSSYVEFETDYGPVRFKDLSLGYRVMISWVVDLTRRMFVRYPGKPDPLAQPAIVLVDEIDLHLHPSWQRNIINYLSKHFKKTQFIVTAHSPLIVQSAQRINVVLLQKDMEKEAVYITNDINATYTGWTLEEILNDLMGLEKTVSDEYIELTKTFGQAVYNEDAETAKRVYKQLDKLLHPENHLRKLLRIQMAGLGGSDLE
ncbi:MAG: AAA family ATPase [bacterium]|nr:AAA family ATPase [bacterium]